MITSIIRGSKFLFNLNLEQKEIIKNSLLIENPAYAKAQKYSKYNVVNIPKYLQYFSKEGLYLKVPIGYKVPFAHEVIDERVEVEVKYPKFHLDLREIQLAALNSYLEDTNKGMISLPTGSGKSILGLYLSQFLKQKTLVIVHKEDLVIGWRKDIELSFKGKIKSGLIKAKSRKVGEQITIATIQTLSRLTVEELEKLREEFGLIIVDECHHITASTYSLVKEFSAKYKVGLSATPERNDGMTEVMHLFLGDFSYVYREGSMSNKDVLPVTIKLSTLPEVLYNPLVIQNNRGSYRLAEKREEKLVNVKPITELPFSLRPKLSYHEVENCIVTSPQYYKKVIKDIMKEFNKGRSILVFLSQKEHCRFYYDKLQEMYDVDSESMQIFYGDSSDDSETIMKRAESKKCRITIATLKKATEGTNVKAWEVVFLVSSMNNGMNVEQAVGRIRRANKGKINPVLAYDYSLPNAYTFKSHIYTRLERYQKLNFKVDRDIISTPTPTSIFKRGLKR